MRENRPIDLQALAVFIATAQDCNMSKAAERLGVSQSAVSQSIRALEDGIGTPLLNRTARPLTLTPAGIALFHRGSTLLEESLNLRGRVIEASQGIMPWLRIGLVDSFAATCGTRLIQQMTRNTAHLSVRTGLTPVLCEDLARRELDLVISSRSLDLDGVANHLLVSERFLLITPKAVALSSRSKAGLQELARNLPIVRFNHQSHLGMQVERTLRRLGLHLAHRLEVDTADTLTSMVAGGIGWAITTPLCLLQGVGFATGVRCAYVEELRAERHIYLQSRRGEYGELTKETFNLVQDILRDHVAPRLGEIGPQLDALIRLAPWAEDA